MKQTIFYICLEPLEERYTKQWYDLFPQEFRKHGFDVQVIDGKSLINHVSVGTFLDINSTVHYKNSQMMEIAKLFHDKKVKNNDIFFIFNNSPFLFTVKYSSLYICLNTLFKVAISFKAGLLV